MHFPKGVQQWKGIGDHGRVGILPVENGGSIEEVVKGLDELRPTIGRCHAGHCPANELQPIVMVVLISPARHSQPVMLILDQTPNQIVQWSQWVELQLAQWVMWPTAPILESERDSIHGLREHALFMPVRPNQLQKTGTGQSMLQDAKAIGQDFVYPVGI